jgi:hypothetical protein
VSAPRRPDGSEYPPDILFLADIFGVEPESIMRSGRTPSERTERATADMGHLVDPDRFAE